MDHILHLRCLLCGKEHRPEDVAYVCPDHGVEGVLDVVYDYDLIRRRVTPESVRDGAGMWRFRGLLPVETETPVPPLLVGDTPLVDAPRLAAAAGVARVWVKDEGRQPTASLKDRA